MDFTISGTSLVKICFSFCTHGYNVWLLNDKKFAMLKCTFKYNNIALTNACNYFKLKRLKREELLLLLCMVTTFVYHILACFMRLRKARASPQKRLVKRGSKMTRVKIRVGTK